jgi:hypothetical protein
VGATLEAACAWVSRWPCKVSYAIFRCFRPAPPQAREVGRPPDACAFRGEQRVVLGSVTPTIALEDFRRELAGFRFCIPPRPRPSIVVGHRRSGARGRAPHTSGLFRALQSVPDVSRRVYRPHRRCFQPAARNLDDLAGGGGDREACDRLAAAPHAVSGGRDRAFHQRGIGGELFRRDLRIDAGRSQLRRRRSQGVRRRAQALRVARVSRRLVQDCPVRRHITSRRPGVER